MMMVMMMRRRTVSMKRKVVIAHAFAIRLYMNACFLTFHIVLVCANNSVHNNLHFYKEQVNGTDILVTFSLS